MSKLYFKRVVVGLIGDPQIHTYAFNINVGIRVIPLNVRLGYNIINTNLNFFFISTILKGVTTATVTCREGCHWTEQALLQTGCYCLNNTSYSN